MEPGFFVSGRDGGRRRRRLTRLQKIGTGMSRLLGDVGFVNSA